MFGEVAVTMLVVMDPPGNMPIFLAVTRLLSAKERNRAAYIAVGTAFFVIALFAIGGRTILDYLNVSVPALRGAGGLLLLLVALQLLYGQGGEGQYGEATPEQRTSVAMVPLGTPLLAGPGTIVATIAISDTPMPNSASAVGPFSPSAVIARHAMPAADAVISATWNRAASASALPWPKR